MHAKLHPFTFVCFALSLCVHVPPSNAQDDDERTARFTFVTNDVPDTLPVIRIYDQFRNLVTDQEADIKPTPGRAGSFDCSVRLPLNSYKTLRIESGESRALVTMTDYQLVSNKLGAFYLSDKVIDWNVCYEFHRSSKNNDPSDFPPKPQAAGTSSKSTASKSIVSDQEPTMVKLTFHLRGVGSPKMADNYTSASGDFRQAIENNDFYIIDETNQFEVSHAVAVDPHRDFYTERKPLTQKEGKAELTIEKDKYYTLIVNPLKKGYAPVVQGFVANESDCGMEFNAVVLSDIPPEVLKARAIQEKTYLGEIVFPNGKPTDKPQLQRIKGGTEATRREQWQRLKSHMDVLDWIINHDGNVPDLSVSQPFNALFLLYGPSENEQWASLMKLAKNPKYNATTCWAVLSPGVEIAPQWASKFATVLINRPDRLKLLGYVSTVSANGTPKALKVIEEEILRYTGEGPKPIVQGIFLDNCTPFKDPNQLQSLYQKAKGRFGADFKILACIDPNDATNNLQNNLEIADVFICSNSADPSYAQIATVQQEIDKRNMGKFKQTGVIHYGLNANSQEAALRQVQTNNCTWCFFTDKVFPTHASSLPDASIVLKIFDEFQSFNQLFIEKEELSGAAIPKVKKN